ncbi:MAG: phytoene desaturase family protein [Bacteroidota bacterium]|nr:phytoene desaturase family protein [Bacteroidota bacterium]
MKPKAVIIGSGIGGLAIAIHLSKMGYSVDLFEKNSYPGGKIYEYRIQGYRFDSGPSLFTMPNLVDELFTLAEENPADYLKYHKLENICRYFYDDGTIIDAWSDIDKFIKEISEKLGEDPDHLYRYFKRGEELYNIASNALIFNSFQHYSKLFKKENLQVAFHPFKLDTMKSIHERNSCSFLNPHLIQLFDHYATYIGSNPYSAPATLKIIPHLEHHIGVFYPEKGMYSIINELTNLALRLDVKIQYNTPVEKVLIRDDQAAGVRINGEDNTYDIVVSDVDINYFYKNLLIESPIPESISHIEQSSSALVFYWGMDCLFPQIDLHNIFFSSSYKEEFDCLFEQKTFSEDPTVYLYVSSKHIPEDAPQGCENWFVMVNAPVNVGQNWENLIENARKAIISKLNRILNRDIEEHIKFEKVMDPRQIEEETRSWQGSLYGNSSNGPFAALYRHTNFHRRIKGLYFTGGSVHPGGGIPLCLASAKIVAQEVINDWIS